MDEEKNAPPRSNSTPPLHESWAHHNPERNYGHFEKEVMKYLKNLALKFYNLQDAVQGLQATVISLGQANGKAYGQVKKVITELAYSTEEVVNDMSTACGAVRSVSWADCMEDEEDLVRSTC